MASAGTTDALIGALIAWIDRLFPDPPRGERLKQSLGDSFGGDSRAVTAEVCAEIEAASHEHSRHLDLQFVADGSLTADTESPGWPPSDPAEMHARAAYVREVSRRANGGGDPGTVALVLDWMLGPEPHHLSDVIYRDRTRQWWTAGRPAELALPAETPFMPEGYVRDAVTGGNWEGAGVRPDVAVEEGDVLAAAVALLTRAVP